jgi:hydroxyacylglutathione hydrolase
VKGKLVKVEQFITGPWKENCYVVSSSDRSCIVIDPGDDFPIINAYLNKENLTPLAVLNTHAHYDHLGAVSDIKERYNIEFYLHFADSKLLKAANFYRAFFLGEKQIRIPIAEHNLALTPTLQFGSLNIKIIHTPGHTPGGVCFEIENSVFSGDTLMSKDIGRTDLPGGDKAALLNSISLLFQSFPKETMFYPGHGPALTLGEISQKNPHASECSNY